MKKHKVNLQICGAEEVGEKKREGVLKAVKRVTKAAALGDAYLSVALVSPREMQLLNHKWRGKDAVTDVLSFAVQDGDVFPGAENVLGDVVICVEKAKAQAKELGHSLKEEIAVLTAHGILHLLGLDHERGEDDARMQAECEMSILDCAGFKPEIALTMRSI